MRQVYRKIPVYTGDVSGVCSALYELGGMVVMHDPSGCNSTYNTHDEIRWYDQDSLIFLSGLNEMDAVMGSDDKLIHDTVEAARIYRPAFIAIANSPIPYITGMDFDAICRIIEKETGIPSFYIMTNGMHDYTHGAGLAFLQLAKRFVEDPDSAQKTVRDQEAGQKAGAGRIRCNILGLTPLDFAASSTRQTLVSRLTAAGLEVVSCWAMGENAAKDKAAENFYKEEKATRTSLLEGIRRSAQADVDLVISSTGLAAADYLKEKYGIPYVAGIPTEGTEDLYFEAVREAVRTGENAYPFRDRPEGKEEGGDRDSLYCLIGEPAVMTSLAASLEIRTGARTRVFGMTEEGKGLLGGKDAAPQGEEKLAALLDREVRTGAQVKILADPLYQDVLPSQAELRPLPHLAFSGRIFLKEIPDLTGLSL